MKKRAISALLALALAMSVCSVVSAAGVNDAFPAGLAEQVFAQGEKNVPTMITILEAAKQQGFICESIWYDEAGNEIEESLLPSQLKEEQSQAICESIWYDEAGNRIEDLELIAELWSALAARGSVGQTCCDNPSYATYYQDNHLYSPPTPANCLYHRTELVVCRNCVSTISRTIVAEYMHVHV